MVLIHTSDRIPLLSHCYQVNDCQFICVKNILLLKGGRYWCTEKKILYTLSTLLTGVLILKIIEKSICHKVASKAFITIQEIMNFTI